jgi:GTPase SAR1 family protein
MNQIIFFFLVVVIYQLNSWIECIPIEVSSTKAIQAAQFAVHELSKLSDSNIYETLELNQIITADEIDGLFHKNILLHLELKSPYFASHNLLEKFHMIVMTHKEDNVTTLAIEEFPVMDDDAIEEFYINKIEERRKMRNKAFEELELEAMELLEKEFSSQSDDTKRTQSMNVKADGTAASQSQEFDVDDAVIEKSFTKKAANQKGSDLPKKKEMKSKAKKAKADLDDLDLDALHDLLKSFQN